MITTVVGVGVDFVIIFFTEIAIPQLMMMLDFVFCIIDFFKPSGWTEQLKCVEERCFKGVDAVADLLIFWSMPVFMHRFVAIMEATLNSRTGRRFFSLFTTGSFTSQGRTTNPNTGETLDNTEPESASTSNPAYEFEFADQFEDWLPTMGADKCGGCFVCKASVAKSNSLTPKPFRPLKLWRDTHATEVLCRPEGPCLAGVRGHRSRAIRDRDLMAASSATPLSPPCRQIPELRIVWLIVAGIGSLISPGNAATFIGNVSQACLTSGSWYEQACGPWPTTGEDTMLPWFEWSQIPFKYEAGFHEYDAAIYDEFAAKLIERGEEIGAAADPEFALLVEASHAWMQVRDTAPYDGLLDSAVQDGRVPEGTEFPSFEEPKAAAFTYHACRVARHEAKKREQAYDSHNDYHRRASGSIEGITNEYLFKTYADTHLEPTTHDVVRLWSILRPAHAGASASSSRRTPTPAGRSRT